MKKYYDKKYCCDCLELLKELNRKGIFCDINEKSCEHITKLLEEIK